MTETNSFLYGQFGDDFKWGTATASYQIEGAWNTDGKVCIKLNNSFGF